MMSKPLSAEQLDILRHMLGINDRYAKFPKPYRNFYCASPGDPEMRELVAAGAVEMYSVRAGWYAVHDGYEWFRCTDAGRQAALASHRTIRVSKSKRVYRRFLEVSDAIPGLTFRDFLVDQQFAPARSEA